MAWKIERWMSQVFPGADSIYSEYRALGRRELAVVVAGVLDLAIAELLRKRLLDQPKECEEFLGLNEDGRAPCGTFGSRIQLALLTGIITAEDAGLLRSIKAIRNKFAHRILVDFDSPQVVPLVLKLHEQWRARVRELAQDPVASEALDEMRPQLQCVPEAGAGLLLAVFCVFQAYFHRLYDHVGRIRGVIPSAGQSAINGSPPT
jgi:hypothetical protein